MVTAYVEEVLDYKKANRLWEKKVDYNICMLNVR